MISQYNGIRMGEGGLIVVDIPRFQMLTKLTHCMIPLLTYAMQSCGTVFKKQLILNNH